MKRIKVLGSLGELFISFLEENNIIISVSDEEYQNSSNLRMLYQEQLNNLIPRFSKYLKEKDIVYNFPGKKSRGNYFIPEDTYFEIDNLRFTIESSFNSRDINVLEHSQISRETEDYDNFRVRTNGQLMRRHALSDSFFKEKMHTFVDLIELNNRLEFNFNQIQLRTSEFQCNLRMLDTIYYIDDLRNNVKDLENEISAYNKDLEIANSKVESYKWLISYMSKNKLTKESKSLLKSKMFIEQFETCTDKEEMLTNMTEILELSI